MRFSLDYDCKCTANGAVGTMVAGDVVGEGSTGSARMTFRGSMGEPRCRYRFHSSLMKLWVFFSFHSSIMINYDYD